MSPIKSTMYVIAVLDLETSAAYYRDVLGFAIEEIGDPGWRIFRRDACAIMAGHCPDATPPFETGDHSYFAYLYVDDLDAYYEEVRSKGARILKKPRNEPWGMREFAMQTIDGHRMMVGWRLDNAG